MIRTTSQAPQLTLPSHFFQPLCHLSFLPLKKQRQEDLHILFYFFEHLMTLHESCSQPTVLQKKFEWWQQEIYALKTQQMQHPLSHHLHRLCHLYNLPWIYLESMVDGLEKYLAWGSLPSAKDKHLFHHDTAGSLFILSMRIITYPEIPNKQAYKFAASCGADIGEARAILRLSANNQCHHCFFDEESLSQHQLHTDDFLSGRPAYDRASAYLLQEIATLTRRLNEQLTEIADHPRPRAVQPIQCCIQLIKSLLGTIKSNTHVSQLTERMPLLNPWRAALISYQIWSSFQ